MIKVRFVDGTGLVSDFIKFWTWSDWSHVEIWTPTGWLGARASGGVQIRDWNYTTCKREEIRVIELDPETEAKIMSWLYAQIGKPYDFMAIAAMPFREDWQSDKRWFCSELVAAAFAQAGVELLDSTEYYRITPRDVYLSPLLKAQ